MINIAKILNDKYYTSPELAEYCVKKTKEIIGEENITEYIEPSAGSGVFLDYLDKPYFAYDIEPEDVGIESQTLKGLIIDSPAQSLALIREALANNPNKTPIAKKAADMIALNAGATIYVAGKADTIKQGVAIAQDIISSGKALQKMAALASFTQQFTSH